MPCQAKDTQTLVGSVQSRFLLMISQRSLEFTAHLQWEQRGSFWVFSLGIFHGVWLIVRGDF